MFFSSTLGGFYDPAIHGDTLPDDAIELSADEFTALILGQAQGMVLTVDSQGRPVLVDPPPNHLYSPSTGKFYDRRVASEGVIPEDAVEVAEDDYEALFDGQAQGQVIAADASGRPVLASPPPPTSAELVTANTAVRRELLSDAGQEIILMQDAVDLGQADDATVALLAQWKAYRIAVGQVDLSTGAPAWPPVPQ